MKVSTSALKPFALDLGNLESIQSQVRYLESNRLKISYGATGDIA
jgi:hypothetical protein